MSALSCRERFQHLRKCKGVWVKSDISKSGMKHQPQLFWCFWFLHLYITQKPQLFLLFLPPPDMVTANPLAEDSISQLVGFDIHHLPGGTSKLQLQE